MSAPDSASADTSWIWRSLDGGKTFKWVPAAAPLGGKVTTCHGGGDTELARRLDRAPLLQRPDARELQRRALGRPGPNVHLQQHRRAGHGRRPPVVRDRRRPEGGRLALPHERRGRQRQRPVREHDQQQHRSSCTARRSSAPARRRGSRSARRTTSRCRARATRGSWATTRSARSRRRPACDGADAGAGRQARLRHPRRRQPEQDPDRALLPGRVRAPIANVSDPSGLNCVDLPVADLGDPDASAPAATSRRSRSTRRATSTRSGSRRRTTPARRGRRQRARCTRTRPTRATTGRRRSQIPTPGLANNVFAWAAAGRRRPGRHRVVRHDRARRPRQRRPGQLPERRPGRGRRLLERLLHADAERPLERRHVRHAGASRASTRSGTAASRR